VTIAIKKHPGGGPSGLTLLAGEEVPKEKGLAGRNSAFDGLVTRDRRIVKTNGQLVEWKSKIEGLQGRLKSAWAAGSPP
jgi:hypothetical protein